VGEANLIAYGYLAQAVTLREFVQHLGNKLGRTPLVMGDLNKMVHKIAWCTGAAQGYFDVAIGLAADVYISGEISEQTMHQAVESGVSYISAGHHATERYGVQALGEHLAEKFNLKHEFIDINNPV
jgi:putative NIF3 family GTP cyclohydrolase 1 type 2